MQRCHFNGIALGKMIIYSNGPYTIKEEIILIRMSLDSDSVFFYTLPNIIDQSPHIDQTSNISLPNA